MGISKKKVQKQGEVENKTPQPPVVPQHQENLSCSHRSILFTLVKDIIKLHIYKPRTCPVSSKTHSQTLTVTLMTLLDQG